MIEIHRFRDADDAVHDRDGYDYDGYKLRVEFPRGGGQRGGVGRDRRGRGPPARRSQYRVVVSGKHESVMAFAFVYTNLCRLLKDCLQLVAGKT